MKNLIKYIFILTFGCLCLSTTFVHAQENTPSFQTLMSKGDKEFSNKEYIKAKTYYQEALRLKPNDTSAKNKLNNTLQKIREETKKEELFFEHIDKGDNFYSNNDLNQALEEYNKALKIFPKDEYALGKKLEISTILKDEKDRLDSFNEKISLGDRLMQSEKYAEAVLQYESALEVYPNNSAAKSKYLDAKNKKEAYDTKITEFDRLNTQGQEFTLRKKYAEAISAYEQALQLFPKDKEIPGKINQLQTLKNISDNYNEKINEADALYEDGSYSQAKEAYQSALLVIPDDSYALGMIDRITEIVNSPDYKKIQNDIAKAKLEKQRQEEERLAAAEAEKQRKAQVQNLINAGNQQLTDKKYAEAENSFNQVLALDPNNAVAIAKLEIIAGFYEEIQRQKMANYNNAMFAGDLAMDKNNFAEAVKQYNIALTYKTGDAEATQKLALARQNEETRVKALEDEYNNYITQADAQYTSKNYDKAIEFYTKAVNVNTGNPYPANKIKQITEMLEANKLVDLVSSAITINANESKRIDFQPIDITVRRSNYIAIKAKSLSEKPVVMYITYGNNTRENGSFTVRVPVKSENDIIVRIGSQYKWFSEDNNWIEIYPENGNIEITSMEITKDN
ncbi:MAG: hypothetical protein IKU05_04025 [Bacteroidales bacterium]|nr:hypothetical protein [Bacteroidales bacterium]